VASQYSTTRRNVSSAFARLVFVFFCLAFAAGVFLPSHDARAAITLVNSAINSASPGTGISATLSATSGNLLVVMCRQGTTSNDTQSVADTAGNTFYPVISTAVPKDQTDMIKMWYAKNIRGSAADGVTCSFGGNLIAISIIVLQYSGADPVAPLDTKATGVVESSAGTYSKSATTTTFSTVAANEVIVVCASEDTSGLTFSAGTGYTVESQNTQYAACEDRIVSSIQAAATASMSSNSASGWEMVLGSFKAFVQGANVSSRSDALADSRPSATSNHTFAFTVNTAVYGSSASNSSTLTLSLDPAFTFPDALDCGDIDAATSVQFNFNWPSCAATATAWGFSVQQSGISMVQQNSVNGGGVGSSLSLAFSNNNTAGNLIVVYQSWDDSGGNTIASVTDTAGNTYVSTGPEHSGTQIFYAKNIKGGANTVKTTFTGSGNLFQLHILEYSGADPISPLDAVSSASSSSGTALDSGATTTHFANELIFGAGNISNTILDPGVGFTNRAQLLGDQIEDKFVATVSSYKATATGDGTGWIMLMATFRAAGGSTLTLTPPSGTGVYVPTSTQVTIKIGSNATAGQQGAHWITNPSAGIYTISVGGTFGGSGNMLVSINLGVTVQATVAESLAFTASSVNSVNCTADDGATVNSVTSTTTTVPFGNISPNTFYQGCQDLIVSTNAGGGYSVSVQESSAMKTANGQFAIPDTTCDGGTCSESVAAAWSTATKNGLGHTCFNQDINHDCNSAYSNGTLFRQLANIAAGETAQSVMSSSTAATATGRIKYRLSAGNAQSTGIYTTLITYTIYAAY
jgi:hypothetical protein